MDRLQRDKSITTSLQNSKADREHMCISACKSLCAVGLIKVKKKQKHIADIFSGDQKQGNAWTWWIRTLSETKWKWNIHSTLLCYLHEHDLNLFQEWLEEWRTRPGGGEEQEGKSMKRRK